MIGNSLIVGRDFSADVRVDSKHLSALHARLDLTDGQTYLSDLGSQNGTTVNAMRIQATTELHDGDVIYFADIGARFRTPGHGLPPPGRPSEAEVQMNLGPVSGDRVAIAGRDVNYFHQRHDSFMRDVAASRSKATWLLVFGFLLFVAGFATFAYGLYRSAEDAQSNFDEGTSFGSGDWFGPEVGGVPIVAIGWGLAFIGTVLAVVGLVRHVVVAARKRSFESAWVAEGHAKGYLN